MNNAEKPVIIIPDQDFINFMEIKSGGIAAGILFRSSSPLKSNDSKKVKAALAIKAGIKCIINLDDHCSTLKELSKEAPWYHSLVIDKKVIALAMTFNIPGIKSNEKKLKDALQFMIANEGPYLIHCFAGVDRTGFVAALLEALMGASLKEICKNYLSAFFIDYNDPYRLEIYHKLKRFLKQLKIIFRGNNINRVNIQAAAEQYLLNGIGLSAEEIIELKNKLSCGELVQFC